MSHNPYLLLRPAVVSFSGGRTSGYLLHQVLAAFGGRLPDDVAVVFCNTGKEREETLAFVERCSQRWGVLIRWLEYRAEPIARGWHHTFAEVNYATASRQGEPFAALLGAGSMLPNVMQRKCTIELKIQTLNRFVRQVLHWPVFTNAIGLRADEPQRYARLMSREVPAQTVDTLFGPEREKVGEPSIYAVAEPECPLYRAGVTLDDVRAFWRSQPFDLALEDGEGNCDLCFLKGRALLVDLLRRRPEDARWWIEQERRIPRTPPHAGQSAYATFHKEAPHYAELLAMAQQKMTLPQWLAQSRAGTDPEADLPCHCTD